MNFNTGNPLPSLDERDLYDNTLNLDQAMNSTNSTWVDRFGVEKPTIDAALKSAGFMPAGFDFVSGGTLQIGDRNKAVYNPLPTGDNNWYRWNGVFPKEVVANSQPNPKDENNWVPVLIKTGVVEREALRRTYLEVGLNLVDGSFETGAIITSTTDVVLHEKTGKCYSGPVGEVPKGTDPLNGNFVDKSDWERDSILAASVSSLVLKCKILKTTGFYTPGVGSDTYLYNLVLSSSNNAGKSPEFIDDKFVLFDAKGSAYQRIYSKNCHPECFGFLPGIDSIYLLEKIRDYAYANGGGDIGPQFDGTVFTISRRFDLDGGVDMTGTFGFHHLGNAGHPANRILNVRSRPSGEYPIGALEAGQIKISLSNSSVFSIGEFVLVLAGRDPYDINEERVRYFAQVKDNTNNEITLSVPCPVNTSSLQPTAGNRIVKFDRINLGTKIGNIHFTREGGGFVDIGLIEQWNIGLEIGVITSDNDDFTLVQQAESLGTKILGISRAYGALDFSSGGRILASWGCSGTKVGFVSGSSLNGCIFGESWTDLSIDSVEVYTLSETQNTVSALGGSNINIRKCVTGKVGLVGLHLSERNEGSVLTEQLTLSGPSKGCVIRGVKALKDNFNDINARTEVLVHRLVELPPSGTTTIQLGYGILTDLSILPFSLVGLGTVYCGENPSTGTAANIRNNLTAEGRFNNIGIFSRYGSDYPNNKYQLKRLIVTTLDSPTGNYIIVSGKCIF